VTTPYTTLNISQLRAYRPKWPWANFLGSSACLKWSFRDLQNLDEAIRLTKGRACAVQAGGNLGIFPKRLAEDFDRVVTFEPDHGLFAKLKVNAWESNVHAIRAALGRERTPVSLSRKRRDASGRPTHEGLTHVSGAGSIPQTRLDDMDLKACDLLYLDIEGYELYALQGAESTIARHRPVIGVEVNRNIEFYGHTADELRSWITSRGYKLAFALNSDEVYTPC
jgi:FkbM family methyltransferase